MSAETQVKGNLIKPGKRYEIHSADGRYLVSGGAPSLPLKLEALPRKITVWKAVEISGNLTIRSPGGWYASASDDSKGAKVVEDANAATHWDPKLVKSQFVTLNNKADLYWTTRPGSEEVTLEALGGAETQAWRFIEVPEE